MTPRLSLIPRCPIGGKNHVISGIGAQIRLYGGVVVLGDGRAVDIM
jgi:hypothetical protein